MLVRLGSGSKKPRHFELFAFSNRAYYLIRFRGGYKYVLWLLAGIVTVVVIVLDHTIFIDLARAGHEQTVTYLKNITDGIIFFFSWIYIAFKEWLQKK